jgi:uncharacterized protein (DUF2252 family)
VTGAAANRGRRRSPSASRRPSLRLAGTPAHRPTPEERAARGKSERAKVSRSTHEAWEPPSKRTSPVALLEEQGRNRLQELLPIRYGRMLASPFAFYRGAAYLMASDLASAPSTNLQAQLCGDAHLSNFGGFAAPDRGIVISITDFDETLPGPFEWDVKRLATSFAVAGRACEFDDRERASIVAASVRAYRTAIREFATSHNLDLWYSRLDAAAVIGHLRHGKTRKRFAAAMEKAHGKDRMKAFAKLTEMVDGERRIVSDPPIVVPIEDLMSTTEAHRLDDLIRGALGSYGRSLQGDRRHLLETYRYAHAARKVVGVGSVGLRAWILLLLGRDQNDPLFLQFKEAERSVLEPFLGASGYASHGQRVVEGQRLMQSATDVLLGFATVEGFTAQPLDFYVRQLWDAKWSPEVESMDPGVMETYAQVCGQTLARAHARSGDAIAIGSYLGGGDAFDRALTSFAESYADQNERDYDTLLKAVATGTVAAQRDL